MLASALFATNLALTASTLPIKNYGQQLIDDSVARHSDLLVAMMHVAPTVGSDNIVVASNIGRIGKLGDEDDLRVIETGVPNFEVNSSGTRFEAELPLLDVSGTIIGAIGYVFPYHTGDDEAALKQKAQIYRDELSRRISSGANLIEPYLFSPLATIKTHAQRLVDALLPRHPELLIVALHVNSSDGSNTIAASNIGRIGKPADADDLRVIATGTPNLEVNAAGNRFEAEFPLLDQAGHTIGAVGLVFGYRTGDDQTALAANAEAIRNELRSEIESAAKLLDLDP